jgi:hypothetical protein
MRCPVHVCLSIALVAVNLAGLSGAVNLCLLCDCHLLVGTCIILYVRFIDHGFWDLWKQYAKILFWSSLEFNLTVWPSGSVTMCVICVENLESANDRTNCKSLEKNLFA